MTTGMVAREALEFMGGETAVFASCAMCGWSGMYYYNHPSPLSVIHVCKAKLEHPNG